MLLYGDTKTYTTQTFGKDELYTFLVFGDPQIGCSGSVEDDNNGWTNTLNHALAKAPNANFLFSMGDQINAYYKYDTSNLSKVEDEYDGFLNAPQLTQLPLATELGNHDGGKWVRYDANGRMIKGWDTNEEGTCYFDPVTGAMAHGTVEIDGKICQFDEATGILK